ncbi:MAG: TldD/PmbA family protein [Candidatus Obscuribacterales bacterium]|nr:TldD/PmbA family protein [Candidatus Obscuribacterales bacterium]
MLSEKKVKKIIDFAIDYAGKRVDGIEVTVTGSDIATSRFALNSMTQNQAPNLVSVSVRVLHDSKQTRLETDEISENGIKNLVDNAIAVVDMLTPEKDLLPLPKPVSAKKYSKVDRFDKKTAAMSPKERALQVRKIIDAALASNVRSSGFYASGSWFYAVGNSRGLFVYHEESSAECSVTIEKENSSGWGKSQSTTSDSVNPTTLVAHAVQTAETSHDPLEVEPEKFTTILPPSAVLDLLSFLWYEFSATGHKDKLSSLIDKVGEKVFGENITITDNFTDPLQAGLPFDGEGMPRQIVKLVENGVLKNLVYGRKSAQFFGVESTGHGLAEPSLTGEMPLNLVVQGGPTSIEDMIASTERGILLSRVWYVRMVDPTILLLTGMTRDGTFLIENGKIIHGLKNMRFNVSLIDLLNNVVQLGPAVRAAGEEGFPAVVPPMKIADFNFTSATKF